MRFFLIFLGLFFSQLQAMNDLDQLMSNASGYNSYFLYNDAIRCLDEVIRRNPYETEAYKEKAFSYFELDRLDLALKDYKQVIHLKSNQGNFRNSSLPVYSTTPANTGPSLEFATGLLYGTMQGGKEGTIEFVSSIRGGLTFLWAFACSPIDVSKELIDALYDIGEFIASGRVDLLLEEALPEFVECRNHWNTWPEKIKGQKLGFIIGKYSILAFYYLATNNVGIHFYNKLKRANIVAILERYSITKSKHILEASAKHAQKSTLILKKAAAGAILPHNPNVLPHVFTKKHRWDKFIKLTGNHEKDFQNLASFLESQKILQCERKLNWSHESVTTYKYVKQIGRDKIVAIFDINKDNLPLLRNAWVEIGAPYG